MTTTTLNVSGMTCAHCVNAVTKELTALPGVSDVNVDLKPQGISQVTVTSQAPLPADAVEGAIDEAGYTLATPVVTAAPKLLKLAAAESSGGACGCGGHNC